MVDNLVMSCVYDKKEDVSQKVNTEGSYRVRV